MKVEFAAEKLLAVAQRAEKFCGRQIDILGIAGVEDDFLRVTLTVTHAKIIAEMIWHGTCVFYRSRTMRMSREPDINHLMFASRTNWNLKPNRLAEALERHKSSGRRLLDLSASNPTECGFKYDAPAIMRSLCAPASLQYRPDPKGLKSARQAVSDYYAEHGESVSVDDLILTASTSEAYSFIFRLLCNPGDELLDSHARLSAV